MKKERLKVSLSDSGGIDTHLDYQLLRSPIATCWTAVAKMTFLSSTFPVSMGISIPLQLLT